MASAVPKSVLDSGVSTPGVGVLGVRTICETCCSFFGPAVAFQGVGALAPTKNSGAQRPPFAVQFPRVVDFAASGHILARSAEAWGNLLFFDDIQI
jgi:hypothetical protein